MYRTVRDTSNWFDNDNKGTWRDKEIGRLVGPGSYYQKLNSTANTSVHKSPSITTKESSITEK